MSIVTLLKKQNKKTIETITEILIFSIKTITKFLFVLGIIPIGITVVLLVASARLHPTNRMHQIPVDTIIVYIKTNTIPIKTLKSIKFSIVFWEGFYSNFTELLNFTGKICFSISKELYFFGQLLKYYMLHGLIYSFLSIWDFKNKWEMC